MNKKRSEIVNGKEEKAQIKRMDGMIQAGILALLILVVMLSFFISPVSAAPSRGDFLKLVGSEVDLTSAWTQYELCNPTPTPFVVSERSASKFDWRFDVYKGYINESHFEQVVNGKIVPWSPVGYAFAPNSCINVRIVGTYDPLYRRDMEIDNVLSVGGYVFDEYAYWIGGWSNRKNVTITNDGVPHTNDFFMVNVSGISLATNNCTKELRLTTPSSVAQDFIVINDGGQALGSTKEWCIIGFNASTAAGGTTLFSVYYNNSFANTPSYLDEELGFGQSWMGGRAMLNHSWAQGGYNYTAAAGTVGEWYNISVPENGGRWSDKFAIAADGSNAWKAPVDGQMNATVIFRINTSNTYKSSDLELYASVANSTHYVYLGMNISGFWMTGMTAGQQMNATTNNSMNVYRFAYNASKDNCTLWKLNTTTGGAMQVGSVQPCGTPGAGTGFVVGDGSSGTAAAHTDYWDFHGVSVNGAYAPLSIALSGEEITPETNYSQPLLTPCNDTIFNRSLVINAMNESSDFTPVNATMEALFTLSNATHTFTYNYSTTASTWELCLVPVTANVTLGGSISYAGSGYQTRSYFFNSEMLDNTSATLDLLMVTPAQAAKLVRFRVSDQYGTAQPDVIIRPQHWYWGLDSYKTVASLLTDADGHATTYLYLDTVWYRFLLYKAGALVSTVSARTIADDGSSIIKIDLVLEPAELLVFPQYYDNIVGSCTYLNATGNLTCVYYDKSGDLLDSASLVVTEYRGALNASSVLFSGTNYTTPNGSIVYNIKNSTAYLYFHTYALTGYVGADTVVLATGGLEFNKGTSRLLGNCRAIGDVTRCGEGAVLAFFLTLTAAMMGVYHPAIGMTLTLAAVVASAWLGLWAISVFSVISLVFVAVLIIWKM